MRISKHTLRINQYQPLTNRLESNDNITNPIHTIHSNRPNFRTIDASKDGKEILKKI